MGLKRGPWSREEDNLLLAFVRIHGPSNWNSAHRVFPGLRRSGKSCRLRYRNHLHRGIRRASLTPAEELTAHSVLGNQRSRIASQVTLAEMHGRQRFSSASPGGHAALISGEDAPVMQKDSPGAGSSQETFNNMHVIQSNRVVLSEITNIDMHAVLTHGLHDWATPALLSVQEPLERLYITGMLPSVQNSFQSLSIAGSELHAVQGHHQQAHMANLSSTFIAGKNDLLEAIGHRTSLSQVLAAEGDLDGVVESLITGGSMGVICDDMWSSMPAASNVGESTSDDCILDFKEYSLLP